VNGYTGNVNLVASDIPVTTAVNFETNVINNIGAAILATDAPQFG
jgi:hypothetical protein